MAEDNRILTTHVGSLPRPQDAVDLVFAEDRDEPVDADEYDRVIGEAVRDRVQHQVQAGIDLVSDGEMSKIGYATFIRHRLSGFEVGDVPRATPADLDAYPSFRDRLAAADAGTSIAVIISPGRSTVSTLGVSPGILWKSPIGTVRMPSCPVSSSSASSTIIATAISPG